MKRKDLIALGLAAVIFLVSGYLVMTQLSPSGSRSASSKTVEVEVIGSIPADYNSDAMSKLSDVSTVKDFGSDPDYNGLGNNAPFGQ